MDTMAVIGGFTLLGFLNSPNLRRGDHRLQTAQSYRFGNVNVATRSTELEMRILQSTTFRLAI